MKFVKLLFFFSVLVPSLTFGQKIKYKDIFPLLNSKSFTPENVAKLNTFLAQEKNPHPNGNLQLAFIREEKFYQVDILEDTTVVNALADSAIAQLNFAKELITEKEVGKKNAEFYNNFYRRDLRTGEFGIKLSDVHLDLEKKIEDINARRTDIRDFNTLLHRIQGRNNLSATIYKQMLEKGGTLRDLAFNLTADDVILLDRVIANAKGLYVLTDDLKESALELGGKYYQGFSAFKIIENYGVDGLEQSDVFSGELSLWDYETWANSAKAEYQGASAYKNNIMAKESALGQAFDQVAQGVDPGSIEVEDLKGDAEKYDPDGSAMSLLDFRSSQLEVNRLSNPSINTAWNDSLNIYAQLDAASKIMEELGSMNTIYSDLSSPEKIELASNRYPGILEEYYGGTSGYNEFMTNLGSWLNEQKIIWASRTDALMTKDQYAVSGDDRVPLFVNSDPGQYMTLAVAGEATKTAVGLDMQSSEAYVVSSGPTRDIQSKKMFKVSGMTPSNTVAKELPLPDFGCYLFNSSATDNNLLLVATTPAGEVKWSNLVSAPAEPVSFRYDETLDQLTVFYYPEDQLPGEGVTYIVIDRSGTVR